MELRGAWFGLRVDRPRLFEASFGIHVDEYLREPGERLRERYILKHLEQLLRRRCLAS